ncbi:hypothetical protein [Streptomyces sp. SID12501]|uniref:Uncharacterized protein n=1 Tax=Streptomyces sp. SID12501 TaxID=2706042 RepID=A0A6B3C568_9ACTN|nr:hypothetical protein [Streptomyces sp. SID12501]NEC91788.1 hypothetical protein [Streptomyces sp. SID12501]
MHVVIAWWDKRRTVEVRTLQPHPSGTSDARSMGPASHAGEFPGLRASQWITDSVADLQGLALIWDSEASADLCLPTISQRMFGCAPSHRWGFEFDNTTPPHGDGRGLPTELDLLLHA